MMEEQEQHYISGFNNGYLLAKHEPDLAAQLAATQNVNSAYFNGLVGGKAEYEKEVREWAKGFSKNSPAKDDRDLNRDR